jgi:predicted dehydrogenase
MLRAGFVGFGRMGITHFSILNTHPFVEIAAICDASNILTNVINKYIDINIYDDYRKMMNEVELDFVVISTPADSHAEIIKAAINYNLHTFAEKPFVLKSSDGIDILSDNRTKRLVTQVGYVNRFNDVFVEIKRLINSGVIGEIINFRSEMYGPTILKNSKSNWRSNRKKGGGCTYEFASHCIDLVIYLIGEPADVCGSIMQHIYSTDVEDLVSSTFFYDNKCHGTIHANWSDRTYRTPTNIFTIFGSKGKILADKHSFKIFLNEEDSINGFKRGWNTRYITDFAKSVRFYVRGNEFTRQLEYFVECIENKQLENISSFYEAIKTDILLEKIEQDAIKSK